MDTWDATFKAQISLAAHRLAQWRERHDQTSNLTKRDIATLIGQGEIDAARSKVERLIQDDRLSDLFEGLESFCKVLLERHMELDQITSDSHSPVLEAVCSLLLAAPHSELKDVVVLGELLEQKYGTDVIRLANQYHGNHIVEVLSKRPPLLAQIDIYMVSIATAYGLEWSPPMLPHQKAYALSGSLDQSASPRVINLDALRKICAQGIPQQPPWLRPRIWKLLLGILPLQKDAWEVEAHSKRQSYYALARRLLPSIQTSPPPTTPLAPLDATLLHLEKSLSPLPHELDEETEHSPLCPFDEDAPEGLRIDAAGALYERLKLIRKHIAGADNCPEIHISVTAPPESLMDPELQTAQDVALDSPISTRSHSTSLLRLLYIHTCLHPSAPTTYLTSLAIPLYVTMVQEIEPTELAHAEADSFWLLAELWGEVGELAEKYDSREWIVKFGKRLAWADPELWDDLNRKGLDPALPHYSYRWLAPLLTRTLSLQSVLTIWDALFTRASRTNSHNAKLEFLLDICTSMLIHARTRLFRLGKEVLKSPGLWGDIDVTICTPSSTSIEFDKAFIQGMAFLQNYPIEEFGGSERIIDTALGLDRRRERPHQNSAAASSFSEKLRGSVLNGFITKGKQAEATIPEIGSESDGTPSPEWPDSGAEDDDPLTETLGSNFLSKIGVTVWRGVTNESSMDVPSSPLPPPSPVPSQSPLPGRLPLPNSPATDSMSIRMKLGNSIWRGITNQSAMDDPPSPTESEHSDPHPESASIASPKSPLAFRTYAEKLKDSDTAATLSKVSTNWAARATTLWGRSNLPSTVSSPEILTHRFRSASLFSGGASQSELFPKRGSLPGEPAEGYSPSSIPHFRGSRYHSTVESFSTGSSSHSMAGLPSPPDLLTKSKAALASLTGSSLGAVPKAGPRPLLLNSSSLITPSNSRRQSRSPTPISQSPSQRDSISSGSSASTSLTGIRQNTYMDRELESGGAGRFVPLRRGAPIRPTHSPQPRVERLVAGIGDTELLVRGNESEPTYSSFLVGGSKNLERRTSSEESLRRGWSRVELPDSPSTLPSTPPPKTPVTSVSGVNFSISGVTERKQSVILDMSGDSAPTPQVEKRVVRKKSWNTTVVQPTSPVDHEDSFFASQEDHSYPRGKRCGHPTNLRLKSDPDLHLERKGTEEDTTTLMPENRSDTMSITPRATDFPPPLDRLNRPRKLSRSPRRPSRKSGMPTLGSGGEEGDDEGYDEFLSAYDSEDLEGKAAP